jgi:hypothetical protein
LLIKYIKSVLWSVAKRLSLYTGRTLPKGLNKKTEQNNSHNNLFIVAIKEGVTLGG